MPVIRDLLKVDSQIVDGNFSKLYIFKKVTCS